MAPSSYSSLLLLGSPCSFLTLLSLITSSLCLVASCCSLSRSCLLLVTSRFSCLLLLAPAYCSSFLLATRCSFLRVRRPGLTIALLNFFSVTSWTFYLLTVSGLLVLRVKEPHLERPYRTWIVTPVIFCGVSTELLETPKAYSRLQCFCCSCRFSPPRSKLWLLLVSRLTRGKLISVFMAAGVPMYYITARSQSTTGESGFKAKMMGMSLAKPSLTTSCMDCSERGRADYAVRRKYIYTSRCRSERRRRATRNVTRRNAGNV